MATIRKRIPWLVFVLLSLTLAGQAAAAFVMPCKGTTSCCCQPLAAGMDMSGPMTAGMTHETRPSCCQTTPSQPCDIASDTHPARGPFLISTSVDRVDGYTPAGLAAIPTDPTGIIFYSSIDGLALTSRGDPPLFLVIQTFLC